MAKERMMIKLGENRDRPRAVIDRAGSVLIFATLILLLALTRAHAQAPANPQAPPQAEAKPEEGIPVTDPLVIAKCGTCHTKDDKGNLSRISWERARSEERRVGKERRSM